MGSRLRGNHFHKNIINTSKSTPQKSSIPRLPGSPISRLLNLPPLFGKIERGKGLLVGYFAEVFSRIAAHPTRTYRGGAGQLSLSLLSVACVAAVVVASLAFEALIVMSS